MLSRRELLVTGAFVLPLGGVAVASAMDSTGLAARRWTPGACTALVDLELPQAAWASVMFRDCVSVYRTQGDIDQFWQHDAPEILSRRRVLAGYTTPRALFVLTLMMQDYGYRVMRRLDVGGTTSASAARSALFAEFAATHTGHSAGALASTLSGQPQPGTPCCWLLAPTRRGPLVASAVTA